MLLGDVISISSVRVLVQVMSLLYLCLSSVLLEHRSVKMKCLELLMLTWALSFRSISLTDLIYRHFEDLGFLDARQSRSHSHYQNQSLNGHCRENQSFPNLSNLVLNNQYHIPKSRCRKSLLHKVLLFSGKLSFKLYSSCLLNYWGVISS